IAISEFLGTAANETAQLALTGQEGDWCIRTDEGLTYIITTGTGSSYSDWQEIVTPDAPVTSVNGNTGVVVLGPSDVGAAAASHTHVLADVTDAGTSAGLDVPASGDAAAGEVVKGTDTRLTDARTPTAHTHVIADTTGLQTALDGKAATSHTHVKADITDFDEADYAAASHTHVKADITDFDEADYAAASHTHVKADITDFDDADYAAASHTHTLSEVTDAGTAAALDVPASGDAASGEVVKGTDTRLTDARTPTAHTHVKADITDFDEADYAAASHTHVIADTTGLQTALDGKAATSHTHVKADITDFDDADYAAVSHTHTASEVTDFSTAADARIAAADLSDLGDVHPSAATTGQVLAWNGTAWAPADDDGGIDLTDLAVTTATASGAGALSYNSSTGDFTFTPADGTQYAAASHTHTHDDITDFDTEVDARIGVATLDDLDGVSVGSPTNGQSLVYDNSTGQWVPGAAGIGAHTHTHDDITDFDNEVNSLADAR
ncbi:MAG: hypothetical protein GY911_10975, partial [Actinomycetales bacterium]|nr:hypothetical protein [Actinomycetales bacterium]